MLGHQTVPVADCAREQFSAHPKSEMKMTDYLSYWGELMKKHKEENGGDGGHRLLYLKDWHLARLAGREMEYNECSIVFQQSK